MIACSALLLAMHNRNARAADATDGPPEGFLWSTQGEWHHENGRPLHAADAVEPGELLQPGGGAGAHEVIVLLPDGQRLLYQCFEQKDCARGFRVPALNARLDLFSLAMLNEMRTMDARSPLRPEPLAPRTTPAAKDEMVATLSPDMQIKLTGTAATLPKGQYSYDLVRIDTASAGGNAVTTEKQGQLLIKGDAPVLLPVAAPGLYEVRIADAQNVQRVHVFVLAVRAIDETSDANFKHAKQVLRAWNESSDGWPMHPLLRLYLIFLAERASTGGER